MSTLKLTRPMRAIRKGTCMGKWQYIAYMHYCSRMGRNWMIEMRVDTYGPKWLAEGRMRPHKWAYVPA